MVATFLSIIASSFLLEYFYCLIHFAFLHNNFKEINIISISLSIIALLTSVFLPIFIARYNNRENKKPVLVFYRLNSPDASSGWNLINIGHGPALDIYVSEKGKETDWNNLTLCYPMGINVPKELFWLKSAISLAATYIDASGKEYTSICEGNLSKFKKGNSFKKAWDFSIAKPEFNHEKPAQVF